MKRIMILSAALVFAGISRCAAQEPSTIPEVYVVTTNTTTFTAFPAIARKIYTYNPGAYDIKIASSSTSPAAKRYTIKAATYFPYPIEINAQLYAIATDSNSVSLELLMAR